MLNMRMCLFALLVKLKMDFLFPQCLDLACHFMEQRTRPQELMHSAFE